MANTKYEIIDDKVKLSNILQKKQLLYIPNAEKIEVFRIRALKDFGDVKKGDLGGYVESEDNLGTIDDCWIYCDSVVCGKAKVLHGAKMYDTAFAGDDVEVKDSALVTGCSVITGNSRIVNYAEVSNAVIDSSDVLGYAKVKISSTCACWRTNLKKARVKNYADISEDAYIDDSCISGCARVHGHATVRKGSTVTDYADVSGTAVVGGTHGKVKISEYATITGAATVADEARVRGHAIIDGRARLMHRSTVGDSAKVLDKAKIMEDAYIGGRSIIYGDTTIKGGGCIEDVTIGIPPNEAPFVIDFDLKGGCGVHLPINLDEYYPVGAIYMSSVNDVTPEKLFGGTWRELALGVWERIS